MERFLKGHGRTLAGVLFLVIGLTLLTFMVVYLAGDVSIWVLGRHTTAEVVDAWAEQTSESEEGELTFQYFVRYRFTTSDGQVITGISSVGTAEWAGLGLGGPVDAVHYEQEHIPVYGIGGLEEGGQVAVVYFPPYPAHNRLDESRFVPILACAYLPLALLSLAGLVAGWHLMRSSPAVEVPSIREVLRQDASDDAPG